MTSPAAQVAADLVKRYGPDAHRVYDELLERIPVVDGAALAYDWAFWARSGQGEPANPSWRRNGHLTGRGWGKTIACSTRINERVERAAAPMLLCLIAQDEQSAIDIQVTGPSGLIATAPPWNRPSWEASSLQLVWPNGSRAYVRTPEVPGKIRGLEYHLTWASELQSWPVATREEAWSNVIISTRLGAAQVIWDSTAKRKHPILMQLRDESARNPHAFPIIRGTTHDNPHLPDGYKEDLERKYGDTSRGREELYGELLDESENALVRQVWIDRPRRIRPDSFARKAIGVDPAVTTRKGSDRTGIMYAASGHDGQAYVLADRSGKHKPHEWADEVIDLYLDERVDVVIVETNKGGDLVTQNLRAGADLRSLKIVVVGRDEKPNHAKGVLYIKEVHTRGPKEDRAQPLATAYERGRISHVIGVDLTSYEDALTTWEPGGRTADGAKSPDQIDAAVLAIGEVLDLASNKPDLRAGFVGIAAAAKELAKPTTPTLSLASLLTQVHRSKI